MTVDTTRSSYRSKDASITTARGLRIGEVARAIDVPIETIRFWERIGLAYWPQRSARGHRVYDQDHIVRLAFLRRARELGFELRELHTLVELAPGEQTSCNKAQEITVRRLANVRARLRELEQVESVLARTASSCADNRREGHCPLLHVLNGGDS